MFAKVTKFVVGSALTIACVPVLAIPLAGTVTDAHTLAPIAGGTVTFTVDSAVPVVTQTDAMGAFSMDVVSDYGELDVHRDGYYDFTSQAQVTSPVAIPMEIENVLVVTARDLLSGLPQPANVMVTDVTSAELVAIDVSSEGVSVFVLPTGSYAICQRDVQDRYLDSCYDDQVLTPGADPVYTAVSIAGGTTTSIELPMHLGATISGHILDRDTGLPPRDQDMAIRLFSVSGTDGADIRTYTGPDGFFSVYGIAPGTYYLGAGADATIAPLSIYTTALYGGGDCANGYLWQPSCDFSKAQLVTVPAAGLTGVDFSVQPGDILSGTVYDRDSGAPIPHASVYACASLGYAFSEQSGKVVADEAGHYRMPHFDVRSMTLTARRYGFVPTYWPNYSFADDYLDYGACPEVYLLPDVSSAPYYDEVNIAMPEAQPLGRIFGVIEFPFIVDGYYIEVKPVPTTIIIFAEDGSVAATLHTDSNNSYTSPPLPHGYYVVTAYSDDGAFCANSGPYVSCNLDRTFPTDSVFFQLDDGALIRADMSLPINVIFSNGFD